MHRPARHLHLSGCALITALLLSGCAGLQSQRGADPNALEGVAYHMPMKYFVLSVTTKDGKVEKLEWSESAAFADLSRTYALRYDAHLIGKTTIKVEVGVNGLLGIANTNTTDSAVALATVQPTPSFLPALAQRADDLCQGTATYVHLIAKPGAGVFCGQRVTFTVQAAAVGAPNADPKSPTHLSDDLKVPGIFYRINRPYVASAQAAADGVQQTKLLFVPNESPTMLLPFGRTLFAANDAKIQLTDGILQKYDQANDGELVALLKFPASILSAYFTAVGNVFSAFGERDRKEAELQGKELQLDILRFKIERCQEALKKEDKAALDALQCSALGSK